VLQAIRSELEANLKDVKQGVQQQSVPTLFLTSAFQSAKNGGHLSLLTPDIQYSLSRVYNAMRFTEIMTRKVFSMYGSAAMALQNYNQLVSGFIQLAQANMKQLENDLPVVLKSLAEEEAYLNKSTRGAFWKMPGKQEMKNRLRQPAKYLLLAIGNLFVLYLSIVLLTIHDWVYYEAAAVVIVSIIGVAIRLKRRSLWKTFVSVFAAFAVAWAGIVSDRFQDLTIQVASFGILNPIFLTIVVLLVITVAILLYFIDFSHDLPDEIGKS
jgi:hypothetical protein